MLSIRLVSLRDLLTIERMERAIFGVHALVFSGLVWHALRWRKWFLVAHRDSPVLGYLIARPDKDDKRCIEIASIAVCDQVRGGGIGTRLITELMGLARERGAKRLSLEVSVLNPRAQALYRRLGFAPQRVIESYYGSGEHGVRMVLDLEKQAGGGA